MASVIRVDFREFQVGDWLVKPSTNTISSRSSVKKLQPQSMNVLVYLAGNAGAVVSSEQILQALWPGVYVGDDAIHRRIADLRKQLEDNARAPRYIQTVQKRGYRLIAQVQTQAQLQARIQARHDSAGVPVTAAAAPRRSIRMASLFVCALVALTIHVGMRERAAAQLDAAIERAEHYLAQDQNQQAYAQIERWISETRDPRMIRLLSVLTLPVAIYTRPEGVEVSARAVGAADSEWRSLGTTPIRNLRLPLGSYRLQFGDQLSVYATNPGTVFNTAGDELRTLTMPLEPVPEDMAYIPGGKYRFGAWGFSEAQDLGGFLIDRTEVSNASYQEFVDAGGYANAEIWQPLIDASGGELTWEVIRTRFVDSTGNAGPGGWALGSYAAGDGSLPVTEVSWYEASAYLAFRGKSLPAAQHWTRATLGPMEWKYPFAPGLVAFSNLAGDRLWPVASSPDNQVNGTFDMIGNAREWSVSSNGALRIAMGSSFRDPLWGYYFPVALNALTREAELGFRGMRSTAQSLPIEIAHVELFNEGAPQIRKVSDDVFAGMTLHYHYTPGQLDASAVRQLSEVADEHWILRTLSVPTGQADNPMLVHVYLPRRPSGPLQSVLFMPPADSWSPGFRMSSVRLEDYQLDFVPRSGRALIWPVYTGTHERYDNIHAETGPERILLAVERSRRVRDEIGRLLDYLEASPEFDGSKVALLGLSFGATMAAYPLALEPRIRTAVLCSVGIASPNPIFANPQLDPNLFWARVRQPVLILNGRFDPIRPHHFILQPLLELLATPDADKKGVLFESAHWPLPRNQMIREIQLWLDHYLGSVAANRIALVPDKTFEIADK